MNTTRKKTIGSSAVLSQTFPRSELNISVESPVKSDNHMPQDLLSKLYTFGCDEVLSEQ